VCAPTLTVLGTCDGRELSPQRTYSAPLAPFEAVRVVNAESRSREESLEECVAELHEALQLYERDAQMPGAMKHGDQEAQVRASAASKSACSATISQVHPRWAQGRASRWR
jgi:hypothetical protein